MKKLLLMILPVACTPAQVEHAKSAVSDAQNYRDYICALAEAVGTEETAKVVELCEQEATLKEIAAAYAGCNK